MEKLALMLRKKYIFALTIIAILVIISNYATQTYINRQVHDSRIINLAGKQRMLSQKITKYVYQLPMAITEKQKHELILELEETVKLWENTHKGLQEGDPELFLPGNNPPDIQVLFDDIQDEHEAMLTAAKRIIELSIEGRETEAIIAPLRNEIRINEPIFLTGMDEIVFKYDDLARIKVDQILRMEKALLIFTLLALLLEALFIFKPAEQLVNKSIKGMRTNEKNLQELFDTAPSMSLIISLKSKQLIRVNEIAMANLGLQKESMGEHYLYDFVETKYLELLDNFIKSDYLNQITPYEVVVRNRKNDSIQMILQASKLFYNNEDVILVNFSDISEQKKNEDMLKNLAAIDEMTAMLNRRTGLFIFEKALETAKRRQFSLAICFVDLDGLKHVNDTYGHLEGDKFIKTIARSILKNVRAVDIAFRYGGDEFVIVFTECEKDAANQIIKRIKEDCQAFSAVMELPYNIDFSYGVALWNNGADMSSLELIEIADQKMYSDKLRKFPDRRR